MDRKLWTVHEKRKKILVVNGAEIILYAISISYESQCPLTTVGIRFHDQKFSELYLTRSRKRPEIQRNDQKWEGHLKCPSHLREKTRGNHQFYDKVVNQQRFLVSPAGSFGSLTSLRVSQSVLFGHSTKRGVIFLFSQERKGIWSFFMRVCIFSFEKRNLLSLFSLFFKLLKKQALQEIQRRGAMIRLGLPLCTQGWTHRDFLE